MTAFALRTQTPFMHIVLVMAGDARRLGVLELRRHVAFITRHLNVHPHQGKARKAVIEGGTFPAAGIMARLAFLTLLAFVHVVFLVTGKTGIGRVLEFLVLVAAVAFNIPVLAHESKSRLAMIEPVFLPVTLAMAIAALLAQ